MRRDNFGTTISQAVYRRTVPASPAEPSSYTWNFSQSRNAAGGIVADVGVDTAVSVDASNGQGNASSTFITAPSLVVPAGNNSDLLIGLFSKANTAQITVPAGTNQRWNFSATSGSIRIAAADLQLTSSGATGNKVATSTNAAANVGALVALVPQAAPPTPTRTPTPTATPTQPRVRPPRRRPVRRRRRPILRRPARRRRRPILQRQARRWRRPILRRPARRRRQPILQRPARRRRRPILQRPARRRRRPILQRQARRWGRPILQRQARRWGQPILRRPALRRRRPIPRRLQLCHDAYARLAGFRPASITLEDALAGQRRFLTPSGTKVR